jgi:hypothetical protein
MATTAEPTTAEQVPCCPVLEPCETCDQLDIPYRLPFRPLVTAGDRRQVVPVEVTLLFRLTRCPGPLSLGDLIYSNTLLPGEKVRLFTSDRHTRFTFDSETKLSYRQETTSEESYYMAGMAYAMSNLNLLDTTNSSSSFGSSSVSGGGSAGIDLGIFSIGGSASASSYDAHSASTLSRRLSEHAESTSRHVEVGTRAASSVSVGEVATRTHQQGESEDQYESSSREFANPNHCHAITFFFYRINKCQTLRFELVSIDRRIDDPAAPTGVQLNPPTRPATGVAVLSSAVLATAKERLDVATRARASVAEEQGVAGATSAIAQGRLGLQFVTQEPIPTNLQQTALAQVDKDLIAEGLLDPSGQPNPGLVKKLSWERKVSLPTPGVLVKGCLDECTICEPELEKQIALDLARKDLENQLLKKQIDLLEKSQEYRCCPEGEEETTPPPSPSKK